MVTGSPEEETSISEATRQTNSNSNNNRLLPRRGARVNGFGGSQESLLNHLGEDGRRMRSARPVMMYPDLRENEK